ncbi:MAG: hypothetical protein E7425_12485 [Ruminococcaceae bacterium]|nr:hypothetical protein [Oscillospiraceae bacterium]
MTRIKLIIKSLVFLCIGVGIFLCVQEVLLRDFGTETKHTKRVIAGLDALEPNSVDVVFLGTSHMYAGMSPMKLYEDYQICSYNLATSSQRISCSYFMLKKALETQHPAVVVCDASALFEDKTWNYNVNWRYILDTLPYDTVKREMANAYAGEWYNDGRLSVYLPIVKYHTRWSELTAKDFQQDSSGFYYTAGQYMVSYVQASPWTVEQVNEIADRMAKNTAGYRLEDEAGSVKENTFSEPLYAPELNDNAVSWFEKIAQLCKENNIELLLIKIPTNYIPKYSSGEWNSLRSGLTRELANRLDIRFLDLNYEETGISFTKDTTDGGHHLNSMGAEKVTVFMGRDLLAHYALRQQKRPEYDSALELYKKIRSVLSLHSVTDYDTYLRLLLEHREDWNILIAAQEEYTSGMTDADYEKLEALGLRHVRDGKYTDAYLAAIQGGTVVYEGVSNRVLSHKMIIEGATVSLESSGWNTVSGSSIRINDSEYSQKRRGLNFVVYDRESGLVIDSTNFDTFTERRVGSKNYSYLTAYHERIYDAGK